jgi:hypothetical protein
MRQSAVLLSLVISTLAVAAASLPATAAETLTIESDQSQLIILPALPGSVVIGNPSIADATVDGKKMFLHGRSFGTTNIMILDLEGNQVAAFEVSVARTVPNALTLIKGGMRYSYNCTPMCESEFQIGDSGVYSSNIAAQMQLKSEMATGRTNAEAKAPAAPQ